jgi:hypothetical protein
MIKKINLLSLILYFKKVNTRNKLKKKLSSLFINSIANKNKNKTILLEFSNWSFNHFASAYVCDILSKKYNAKIEAFASYPLTTTRLERNFFDNFLWRVGNLLSLKIFGIYRSFGTKKILWPEINYSIQKKAINEFKKFKKNINSKEDIQNYKVNNILIGDLIYDSYLKRTLDPTIDITSLRFKSFFLDSLKLFFYWDSYFIKNDIRALILFHSVYLGAIPLRIAMSKNLPIYILNINKLYKLNKNRIFSGIEYLDFKMLFKKLSNIEKTKSLKIAKKKISERFSGILSSELIWAKKSAYSKNKNSNKVLVKSKRIKILIAAHSFCDSPHIYGKFFFPDFYVWLDNLGRISNETNYDWYIKCHPDYNRYFDNTTKIIKDLLKKYPKIKYLDPSTSHIKIINEGIDYVLTVHGTIAGEYPYAGVNAINASNKNSQIKYDFTITPKNQKQYLNFLRNLKKPNKVNKEKKVLEHYYMKYEYFNNRWFFKDTHKVKIAIGGYNNFFREEIYHYWLEKFDFNSHNKRYSKIEEFINSNNYVMINK